MPECEPPSQEAQSQEARSEEAQSREAQPQGARPRGVAGSAQVARQRLRAAVVRPSRRQLTVALLLAVVGFAAVTQVNAYRRDATYAGYRQQDLIDVFSGLSATYQRAEQEIADLEQTRRALETTTSAREAALAQTEGQVATLSILAGLVPVAGPGIRITIEDPKGQVSIDSLLDLVQELRTAGAESIEVNDQVRVVAQTSLEVGPGGVKVDGQAVGAPYTLDAIGEPGTLAGAVNFFRGPLETMRADEGAVVTVEELDLLDIESVRPQAGLEFAQPAANE